MLNFLTIRNDYFTQREFHVYGEGLLDKNQKPADGETTVVRYRPISCDNKIIYRSETKLPS